MRLDVLKAMNTARSERRAGAIVTRLSDGEQRFVRAESVDADPLATELEDTEISVTALCPGPTDTDFFPKAGMMETKAFQKAHVMAPQEVAELAYKGLMRGDRTVVAGGSNKALTFARRFMTEGAQAKMNKKFYERAKPTQQKRQRGDFERKAARKQAEKEEKELAE